MNVGRLRQLIANLPDDAPIFISGRDHRLARGVGYVSDVIEVKGGMRSRAYYHAYDYEPSEDEDPMLPVASLIIE